MEAYIGYANFTINAYEGKAPSKPEEILNLKDVYNRLTPHSIKRPTNKIVKSFTIHSIEVCSASRGCTPKKYKENKDDKNHILKKHHNNYLTVYKNGETNIKTNKNIANWTNNKTGKSRTNYVLLNIKATCKIGDSFENVSIRIPRSAVVGIKIGLSTQNKILLTENKNIADYNINYLGYELAKIVYAMTPVPALRPYALSGLSIQGFNLHNYPSGLRPNERIKNFLATMLELDEHIKTHDLDFEPSESKTLPRANFKSKEPGRYPTFGITTWLMMDFSGVKSIEKTINLSRDIFNAYRKTLPTINWNINYNGPVPKSRRGIKHKEKKKKEISKTKNNNVNLPVWNKDKKKFTQKGKVFQCMSLSKTGVAKLAKSLQVNSDGFKKDVCARIESKIKK